MNVEWGATTVVFGSTHESPCTWYGTLQAKRLNGALSLPSHDVAYLPYNNHGNTPPSLERTSKLTFSTTRRVQTPNDASVESSRRDVFKGTIFVVCALYGMPLVFKPSGKSIHPINSRCLVSDIFKRSGKSIHPINSRRLISDILTVTR